MIVRVLKSAKKDIYDGSVFYDEQEEGVGDYFAETIFDETEALRIYAGIHKNRRGIYRLYSHKFPFWIYYRIENECAYVVAVLDARQNPRKILARENRERRRKLP